LGQTLRCYSQKLQALRDKTNPAELERLAQKPARKMNDIGDFFGGAQDREVGIRRREGRALLCETAMGLGRA